MQEAREWSFKARADHRAGSDVSALLWIRLDFQAEENWLLVLCRDDGCVCFLDADCRIVFETQVHSSPILSVHAHNLEMGIRKETTAQGLTFTCGDGVVLLLPVEELLRIYQHYWQNPAGKGGQRRRRGSKDSRVAFSKYDLSSAIASVSDAVTVGYTSFSLKQMLLGNSWSNKKRKIRLLAGGSDPALVCAHVEKNTNEKSFHSIPLLSTALELVPSLPFVGRLKKRLQAADSGRGEDNGGGGGGGGDKKEEGLNTFTTKVPFVDPKRRVTSLALAPDYPLVSCCDSLGRVLVVDATHFIVKRVLKGYRDAETGWLHSQETGQLYLAIFAPRRCRVDMWDVFQGKKVKHVDCKASDLLCKPPCAILTKPSTDLSGSEKDACLAKISQTPEGLHLSMIEIITR